MQSRQTTDVVLQALTMATWRRKPKAKVLIHSDQGSQFTSMDWAAFLRAHNLQHSMSRRGNCHDNAVAESFFNLLKRKRIRRRTYRSREEARRDVFDYIEMFCNPKRKHARNGMLSPVEFERQRKLSAEGVWKTRGYSNSSSVHLLRRDGPYPNLEEKSGLRAGAVAALPTSTSSKSGLQSQNDPSLTRSTRCRD